MLPSGSGATGCRPMPSSNRICTARTSCPSTTRTFLSAGTSGDTITMEQQSIFSQPGGHASPCLKPGSAEARKMTAGSGQRLLDLYKQRAPGGLLGRMLLASYRWNSTKCLLTWRTAATPAGRLLFRLQPSMPTTAETESGLLPTLLKSDWKRSRRHGYMVNGGQGSSLLDCLLPTVCASAWKNCGPPGSQSHAHRLQRRYLDAHIKEINQSDGNLNPDWLDWFMGYPPMYTDLQPWEMQSCPKWQK